MTTFLWMKKNANLVFFIGGFLFDSITMTRIDSALDLFIQFFYLAVITILMNMQARVENNKWAPSGRLAQYWQYDTEVLHFCYGGLLSGFIVFYFKSTSFSRSFVFLALIAVLMVANEMPQVRKWGNQLRLGLYAFCVVSYLNYLLPVLIGRMGWPVFLLGWIVACALTLQAMKWLSRAYPEPQRMLRRFTTSPALVLLLVLALYALKLIPPVPLSVKHLGLYRAVQKEGDRYLLVSRKPAWYKPWATDNRTFPVRAGDEIYTFVSVFGPRGFTHRIFIRWMLWDEKRTEWLTADRFPIALHGGRKDGFRGHMRKENYQPGRWRVNVETEDERVLGSKTFQIVEDTGVDGRRTTARWY